jgi:predicted nucleic acid-binding protein
MSESRVASTPRPRAYFDSSVIAKQYLAEHGSALARRLYAEHSVVSSLLAPLEVTAAFRRRRASREMTESEYQVVLRRMADDRAGWDLVALEADVLRHAERLIRRVVVRTLDAIHIASAAFVAEAAGISVPFVTGDARQRAAAEAEGLRVVWVA